jgi:ABC-type transport system involved in multi-copper enzyme maturation permease subunit
MSIVLKRDFRELRQTSAFRIVVILAGVIAIAGAAGISIALKRQDWLSEGSSHVILEFIISLVVYFLPLLILITFIWAFGSLPVTKEKVNGNIECLLATPLSPGAIWMGKSLAIFLPGYVISIVATLIVLLAVNLIAIVPATGSFVLPAPALLTGFLVNPLLFFGLLSFIILFSLAGSPDIAIAPSFLLGFGLMIGIPVGLATGLVNPASWSFALWYLAGTALAWAIVLYLSRLLTRQNIVLSSKGE